ncbi:MAG: hypothetical protein K9L17_14200 [Clostridiales bacterium]|nr:hypothetical protein [Clostridiales bacterium]MCF8023821.1 hypothetical protein [Clostridiales bacterium]
MRTILLTILILFFSAIPAWATASWEYRIDNGDTPSTINEDLTNCIVDTTNNEIRLPRFSPNSVAFWPDGSTDYVVMTPDKIKHFSWTGADMVENDILSIPNQNNPLAIAAPSPYPDVVMLDKNNGLKHYSFTGSEMVENPALSVSGMTGTLFLGAEANSVSTISNQKIYTYTDGSRNYSLEPDVDFTNPIGLSLYPDKNNMIVLDNNKARFFMSTGSNMVENPALAITGLNNPKCISSGDSINTAIIDGNEVEHYSFDGSSMQYNSVLSVPAGELNSPTAVALCPGTNDRIIVDGNEVKYYRFDSGNLVYDADRSVTVNNLDQLGGYAPKGIVISEIKNPPVSTTHLRIRAYHDLPKKTSITWYLTTDGSTFTPVWRVKNDSGNKISEKWNGSTWTNLGEASLTEPSLNNKDLWVELPSGQDIAWKAELTTSNFDVSPKIKAPTPGDTTVKWEAGNPPSKPNINLPDACYPSTTPQITWSFSDPDPTDSQSAYEAIIKKKSDNTIIYESGVVNSSAPFFEIPTSESPDVSGPLWASGEYRYTFEIKTYDSVGIPSEWTVPEEFCVIGLERPRIKDMVSAADGQTDPIPDDISTHLVIPKGMTEEDLPITKTGAKISLLVDSVGPLNSLDAIFPYLSKQATVHSIENKLPAKNPVNRWKIEFWTDASIENVPNGTVVDMDLTGHSPEGDTKLSTTDNPPYAVGIVKTNGSIYEDWTVILESQN